MLTPQNAIKLLEKIFDDQALRMIGVIKNDDTNQTEITKEAWRKKYFRNGQQIACAEAYRSNIGRMSSRTFSDNSRIFPLPQYCVHHIAYSL